MTQTKFRFGVRKYLLYTLAFITSLALSPVPSVRLLWMAGILAAVPVYVYLRFHQIAWGYLIMIGGLATLAGLMWIHPGLPWVFFVPVIFFGFVVAPIWRALRDSREPKQSEG